MDAAQVEAEVRRAADEVGLQATAAPVAQDGYVEVALTAADAGDRRTARIASSGVEAFFLTLDDRYDLREFDWEPDGQREAIRTLVAVAAAHLRGSSRTGSEPRRLRGDREFLEVTLDGEAFRAYV